MPGREAEMPWVMEVLLQELAHNGLGCGFERGRVPGSMGAATDLCA